MRLPSRIPTLPLKLAIPGRRSGETLVGLDIQPGFVAAVKARVNGSIAIERAAAVALPADSVRDGEVFDEVALGEALRELFARSGMSKRVRVGVASQRTVLRTLEVPPVTDAKELAAAVAFQAQDQVPMPLDNAVLDFHALGIVDTPSGQRQRVVLVAAQRDMVERLLAGVRHAGLTPMGVDLSAFALIRSLYRPDPEQTGRILYLNVDGLTNLAIAEGTVCRFTRVVGRGLEDMASELAERRSIPLTDARALLAGVDLRGSAPEVAGAEAAIEAESARQANLAEPKPEAAWTGEPEAPAAGSEAPAVTGVEEAEERERAMSYEELAQAEAVDEAEPVRVSGEANTDVRSVLENGIRDIAGEVRNSLDFHRSQDGGGEVSHVVMSGAAQDIAGFAEALQSALGIDVRSREVGVFDETLLDAAPLHRLAVATGLAVAEVSQ